MIDFGNTVPRVLVLRLLAPVGRHVVVSVAMTNRALFDVLDLPQDRGFVIR